AVSVRCSPTSLPPRRLSHAGGARARSGLLSHVEFRSGGCRKRLLPGRRRRCDASLQSWLRRGCAGRPGSAAARSGRIMSDPVTEPAGAASCGLRPILLAVETAGSRCSAAVTRGGAVLAAESRALRHGHSEALMPMLDRVRASAGLTPHDIDIV